MKLQPESKRYDGETSPIVFYVQPATNNKQQSPCNIHESSRSANKLYRFTHFQKYYRLLAATTDLAAWAYNCCNPWNVATRALACFAKVLASFSVKNADTSLP